MSSGGRMMKEYTPRLVERCGNSLFATMLVQLQICPGCKNPMIVQKKGWAPPFPSRRDNDFEAQALRAGWGFRSSSKINNDYICQGCEAAGQASFTCALCSKEKASDALKTTIGYDPADRLCIDCYRSVSAETWIEKIEELEENHKWDFS